MHRLLLAFWLVLAAGTFAASRAHVIESSTVVVDASVAPSVSLRYELEARVEGETVPTLDLWLHEAIAVTAATANGKAAKVSKGDEPGTRLVKWTIGLGSPVAAGNTARLVVDATLGPTEGEGIRVGAESGWLLPGSGWFPATELTAQAQPQHDTKLLVPAGRTGIAAGRDGGAGTWSTSSKVRPFAAWGDWVSAEQTASYEGTTHTFRFLRRPGAAGGAPSADDLAALVYALGRAVGEACGSGPWTFVDAGHAPVGGERTVFWDEKAYVTAAEGDARELARRDVAGALAASFWTECVPFQGDAAAWLSSGFSHYLGDVATIALDPSDDRTALEKVVIGSRRQQLIDHPEGNVTLAGYCPLADAATVAQATRGALIVHVAAEAVASRTRWLAFLTEARAERAGMPTTWSELRGIGTRTFAKQLGFLEPWLHGNDLPAFRIVEHGRAEGRHKNRYRVEVENRGTIDAYVQIATFTPDWHPLYNSNQKIPAGGKQAVLFGEINRIGHVVVDPRGVVPQSELVEQTVDLGKVSDPSEQYVPAFSFVGDMAKIRNATGLTVELAGVTVKDFDGAVQPYATHHGPSGAALIGTGTVIVSPGGKFAESFQRSNGRAALTFEDCTSIFLRFPPSKWKDFEAFLGDTPEDLHGLSDHSRWMFQSAFPTYFHQGNRAEVPPPGSSLATFIGPGNERRGMVIYTGPDGKVHARFWDHLTGKTIWEETR